MQINKTKTKSFIKTMQILDTVNRTAQYVVNYIKYNAK